MEYSSLLIGATVLLSFFHFSEQQKQSSRETKSLQTQWVIDVCVSYIIKHYNDVIMSVIASQITGVAIICSAICSGADQRKHQSSASLAFVMVIHRWPVNSPHKWPVSGKMFLFDDVLVVVKYQLNMYGKDIQLGANAMVEFTL